MAKPNNAAASILAAQPADASEPLATSAPEDSLGDYLTMSSFGGQGRVEGARRLATVDLAVRGRKGDRFGLTPQG